MNKNLPTYEEITKTRNEWTLLPTGMTVYHDNGVGYPEKKFVHRDGREAVYTKDFSKDGSYQLYTDPKYKGTYNYVVPSNPPQSITDLKGVVHFAISGSGHFITDVLPYHLTGKKNERNE